MPFVISPLAWVVAFLLVTNVSAVIGWKLSESRLDATTHELRLCHAKSQAFKDQIEAQGRLAAERVRATEENHRRIANETATAWASALDSVRADAARRVRNAIANAGAGGSGVSATATTGLTPPIADPDPIPPSERVAADCAETTLTANALQSYIEQTQPHDIKVPHD